jgi:hypothetical protein
MACNKDIFTLPYKSVLKGQNFQPYQLWNSDQRGMTTVHKSHKVFVEKKFKVKILKTILKTKKCTKN